jgi:hypothetical protein
MQSTAARREAIRKFKEQKPSRGAFAVRCTATDGVWVGSSVNLHAIRNRLWFSLRTGICPDKALQAEWNVHGEDAFQYEILEKLDDDVLPLEVADLLKEKRTRWTAQLGAQPL